MKVVGIAGDIPVVIKFTGTADIVEAVVEENRRAALSAKDTVDVPAPEHLRKAGFGRQFVAQSKGEAVANVGVGIGSLRGWIEAVLNVELTVAARSIDGVRPGISGNEIYAFGCVLSQRDLQAVVDRVSPVGQFVDIAQSGELSHEWPAGLFVSCRVVGKDVLIGIANVVEPRTLITSRRRQVQLESIQIGKTSYAFTPFDFSLKLFSPCRQERRGTAWA